MPAEQVATFSTELLKLLPIISGAAIGITSGIVSTRYSHRLKSSDKKSVDLRIKLEELVNETFEVKTWIKRIENHRFFNGAEVLEKGPIAKIEAISAIYFPELKSKIEALIKTESNYRLWIYESKSPIIDNKIHIKEMNLVYKPLIHALDELVKAASNQMKSLYK